MTRISNPAPPLPAAVLGTDEADIVVVRKLEGGLYEIDFNGEISIVTAQQLAAMRFDLRGGDDSFFVDEEVDVGVWVYGGSGEDWIQGGAGNDQLRGGDDDDDVFGGGGNDSVWGGGGNDRLRGEEGNDDLSDVYGRNRLDGGDGNDRMIVGTDMGRPPEAWRNELVDFDDLTDSRLNGGWSQFVRATKTAAPYDSPSWHLHTHQPLPDDPQTPDAAKRRRDPTD